MSIKISICTLLLFAAVEFCHASETGPLVYPDYTPIIDTLTASNQAETEVLYDSIQSKTNRRAVPRLLYKLLFTKPRLDTTASGEVIDQGRIFARYQGRSIGEISIIRDPVFDTVGNRLERIGNKIHVMTRERVIRRDLLFKSGDRLDPQLLVRNAQLLRSRRYISDVSIDLVPNPKDSTQVDVVIRTQDNWSISADLSLHSEGRTSFGMYDANIFGTGNRLSIKTNFNRNNFDYGGNLVAYEIPNILGSFFQTEWSAGRNFYNSEFKISVHKEFIRPTDYELGVSYNTIKSKYYRIDLDSATLMKVRTVDAWAGRSRYLRSINSSIFLTGRYSYVRHALRPDVYQDHNTAFHDYDNLLMGLGLYREKFYTANMIYGFGFKEYLATGYKAELVSGFSWGEFNEDMYLGMSYKIGGFTSMGYLMGGYTLGSYINLHTGTWRHSAIDIDMRWFSNLFIFRRNRIRQFLTLNYTQGWNRGTGSNELIGFTRENGLQALDEHVTGVNRIVFNTETVVFIPYQPLGFRIAVFGFADFGLLGNSANMFKNAFYTTLGLGIRIKNERLIFGAVQLRLGIALGKNGVVDTRWFDISNQTRLEQYRYLPTRPEIVGFR